MVSRNLSAMVLKCNQMLTREIRKQFHLRVVKVLANFPCLKARENFNNTHVKFFPDFTRHHSITHTYYILYYIISYHIMLCYIILYHHHYY